MRSLARIPAFSIVCMLTLALGIGATTSMFSAIYHIMLRPMPFKGGDRLAYVWMNDSTSGMAISPSVSFLNAWRGRLHSFDAIESYAHGEYTLLGGDEPELVKGAAISQNLPAMLGVAPVLGRSFTNEEMQQGSRDVVMLSETLWKKRFGGTRDAIGRQIDLADGKHYQVVGVMPNVFSAFESYQHEGQIWFPLRPDTTSRVRDLNVIGRMKAGVDMATAEKELAVVASGVKIEENMPGHWTPKVMTPQAFLDGTTQSGLKILFAAVAVVLLIGCANIAGLLLVRLGSRQRELAIRAAVGARRSTIIRLLAVESVLLAIGGGIIGVFVSSWVTATIRTLRPESLNSLDAIATDRVSLAFAAVLSLITAVVFGVAPIISALRRDLTGGLITSGTSGRVTSSNRMRSIMVGGQIALSLVLLVASLLLVRSVQQLQKKDLGFNPDNVLTFGVQLPSKGNGATNKAFYDQLLPALRHMPGVTAVSLSTGVPSSSGVMFGEVTIPGRTLTDAEKPGMLGFVGATPDYMKAIGLRLREGRFLTDKEDANPIVINESWAKKLWPRETAIGKQIRIGNSPEANTVVGVVADVSTMGPTVTTVRPHVYLPFGYEYPVAKIAIRTDGRAPSSLVSPARAAVHAANPNALPRDIATLRELMADTFSLDRFYMQLLSAFAGLALVLSAVGLYGVISNTVSQRTREIGVRMALGATPAAVQSMVFRQGLRIVAAGLVIGLVAAIGLVRFLSSALHGFSSHDPVSFAGATAVLAAGAMIATYLPARRAVRVDPLDALRTE
jgi:predicted permease